MVSLRMTRMGAKKKPSYRIVAADSRFSRDGRFIEQIGFFDPMKDPSPGSLTLQLERVDYWLKVGAQPSDTVASLIRRARKMAESQGAATSAGESAAQSGGDHR